MLLSVENLTIRFDTGQEPVVKSISFQVDEAETLGIVGESGSGKSVSCFSLLKLLPKSTEVSGKVLYKDKSGNHVDLLTLNNTQLQQYRGKEIGFVFQEPMSSLNPAYTCGDQVAEGLRKHMKCSRKEAHSKTISLFEEVLLPDPMRVWKAYPHELSGGQRQRVMIAMALASDPRLLIADEPTTALDVTVQKVVVELIKNLSKQRKMGVIFISHDLNLVGSMADRIMVMKSGEIVEMGMTKNIFEKPQHGYTQNLLQCRPSRNWHLPRLPVPGLVPQPILPQENTGNPILLKAENLSKSYISGSGWWGENAETKAVVAVSFDLEKGKTLGIVGESGSGKSTISRLVLGLTPITSGKVYFGHDEISGLSRQQFRPYRRQMQMIFQDPYSSLNPKHSIGSILTEPMDIFGIGNKKERLDKAEYLLKKTGLPAEYLHRYPHQLSGGQRQRVCIARALMTDPAFIICDESVAALDVSVQAQVLNLLKDLQDELGLTYLFITHDLAVARFMSHQLLVMQKGKAEEYGKAADVFSNPKAAYTKKLLDSVV